MKTRLAPAIIASALISFVPIMAIVAQSTQPLMKAAVVHDYGGPEVFRYEDVPRPEPKDDEVLVRVIAAGVNPVDAYVRQGMLSKRGLDNRPMIIGYDVAGVVEKTGSGVPKFKVGDTVYAYLSIPRGGGYAEYALAKQDEMALKPKNIDFVKAAAVPLAATTAWQALVDSAKIDKGQKVLIHGGSGGVGSFAVQIAKARGAKVIATASSANQDVLKQLGVDQPIDYTTTKFENVVKNVDVVLNCVRADTLPPSYGVVKKGGIIVSITGDPDAAECAKRGIRCSGLMAHPDAHVLEELTKLIEANKITPIVSQTFPLMDVAEAHRQIETHHTRGKIVLKVAPERK
ncbi:MAG TPA: NADP-dependent oxidoreductase [Candidatus Udaeobacter sp.]|nr:NADP-dependent oxidoreductase [Candidatus Udaeobacter sp.]